MVKAKEVKAEVAKPEQVAINVDKQEFIRTRDALITSWVHLEGALRDATHAYISHSNAVLGGEQGLDISKLDLTTFLGGQFVPSIDLKAEEDDTKIKAKRAPRKPKDPNAPKRPLTAYLAWLGDNREKIHGELGENQGRGGISAEGTKRWHALPDQAKQDYKNKYEKENERYKEDLKAYQARGGGPLETPAAEEELEIAEPEAKAVSSDSDSDSDSTDSDSESESEVAPPKEPTPPPAKTPRSAAKGGKKKAAAPVSSPPPAVSSPAKADDGTFTAVNGTANNKRKKDAKAETAAEEPKTKRTRKVAVKEAAPAPVVAPAEPEPTPKREKRDRKKARKSVGGDA